MQTRLTLLVACYDVTTILVQGIMAKFAVVTSGVVARIRGGFSVQKNRPQKTCRYFAIVATKGVVI